MAPQNEEEPGVGSNIWSLKVFLAWLTGHAEENMKMMNRAVKPLLLKKLKRNYIFIYYIFIFIKFFTGILEKKTGCP